MAQNGWVQKSDITVDLARRLVRDQFPEWAGLLVTPVEHDGWDNTSFRLGDTLVVRLPSADGYVAQIDKEQRWLPVLAASLHCRSFLSSRWVLPASGSRGHGRCIGGSRGGMRLRAASSTWSTSPPTSATSFRRYSDVVDPTFGMGAW